MTARRSEDSQAVLLAAAREALDAGDPLRAIYRVADARRLGPWSEGMERRARALEDEALPMDDAA